jgi:hypothetical protein
MLTKLSFKPGVNRENTRYTNEGGFYESNLVRFRQGTPEKIGGWVRISANTFLGICRSLWQWVALTGFRYTGVGTNLKMYVENGGSYSDITPLRATVVLNNPFVATNGSNTITVTDAVGGYLVNDFVTFSGAVSLGGNVTAVVLNKEYQIRTASATTFTIQVAVTANGSDTANGGAAVSAAYQINTGPATTNSVSGWSSGSWSSGPWSGGAGALDTLRIWSQTNFGEDLVFNPRTGGLYYWDSSAGTSVRAVNITTLPGASDVPTKVLCSTVSDVSRFVITFGCNQAGSTTLDPMLIRWSDQESVTQWTPASTNQSGFLRLSYGSTIVGYLQNRQEILVWTDVALYSMQFLGYPEVWGAQLLANNISIIGPNAMTNSAGGVFWMGVDKFYKYDGRANTQRCDLRQYIFSDIALSEAYQTFAGTNEGFNEVWWWYCKAGETAISAYVVYNYEEDVWYYGEMARTAWIDSGLSTAPIGATYSLNLVNHETGLNDNTTGTPVAMDAYILSSEFDIGDGHNYGFVWRILPDLNFTGSTAAMPQLTMTLYPLKNSGSGYTDPASVAGSNYATVTRTSAVTIEQFTGQIYTRVRGRQMAFKISSDMLDVQWQLGATRIDIRPDGRAG